MWTPRWRGVFFLRVENRRKIPAFLQQNLEILSASVLCSATSIFHTRRSSIRGKSPSASALLCALGLLLLLVPLLALDVVLRDTHTHTHSHARISHKGGEQWWKRTETEENWNEKTNVSVYGGIRFSSTCFAWREPDYSWYFPPRVKKGNFRLIPRSFLANHFKLRRIQENQIHGKLFRERKHSYCI